MTWERISCQVRFLVKPSFPVTQNKQFTGHPTWEETQIVIRFSFLFSPFWYFSSCQWYIITLSIRCPSSVLNPNFVVSSVSTVVSISSAKGEKKEDKSDLNSLERVVISSRSIFWFLKISWKICFNLKFGILCSLSRGSIWSLSKRKEVMSREVWNKWLLNYRKKEVFFNLLRDLKTFLLSF